MKPITAGQIGGFIEILAGKVSRGQFQQRLEDPGRVVEFFQTGAFAPVSEQIPRVKLATIGDMQKLGLVTIGSKEVNQLFGTLLKLDDCPIGFTSDQAKGFVERAKDDFQIDKPPVALILLINKSGDCKAIDLPYLKQKFGKKLYSDWYINENEAKDEFARQPVRKMWVLTYFKTNPTYTRKNWQSQQELAINRQEQILTAPEEAYCQLVVEGITGQRGKSSTWDRTSSAFGGNPVYVGDFDGYGLNLSYYDIDSPEARSSGMGAAAAVISKIDS